MRKRPVTGVNRFVAFILGCVWLAGAAGGIAAAFGGGRRWLALPSLLALAYGVLWLRVFAQSRLLTWSDAATPWRAGARHPDRSRVRGMR
jgi:hypothetical protein